MRKAPPLLLCIILSISNVLGSPVTLYSQSLFCCGREVGLRSRSTLRERELLLALEELHAHERINCMHRSLQAPSRRGRTGKAGEAV